MSDIKIKINNEWINAREHEIEAFHLFKNIHSRFEGEKIYNYNFNNESYTIKRLGDLHHGGIYIIKNNEVSFPIADWNDVKVFINNEWLPARSYQTYSYFDYIYSVEIEKKYKSKNTQFYHDHIELPIDNIEPDIVFSISRNENNTIYYCRNDDRRSHVRMSDNDKARKHYLGYINRINDNSMFDSVILLPSPEALKIPENVVLKKTLDDDLECTICNDYEQNIIFLPCNHTKVCSECYKKLVKKHVCPYCNIKIDKIEKKIFTPV